METQELLDALNRMEKLHHHKNYQLKGVLGANQLPSCGFSLEPGDYLIVNTDPIEDKGTHWLAIYCYHQQEADGRELPQQQQKVVEIFDSYGYRLDTYPVIKQFIIDRCTTDSQLEGFLIRKNDGQIQEEDSTVCGAHCLLYLALRLYYQLTMSDIIDKIYSDNLALNDCLALVHYNALML